MTTVKKRLVIAALLSVFTALAAATWAHLRWQMLTVGILVLLETALIVSLLHERRRRRRAEIETHSRITEIALLNRRATVGELSGAIAHELNQPLGAILRNSEAAEMILQSPFPDVTELREILLDIRRDDERAGEVIRRLRRLLSKAPAEQQEIDLNLMLTEVFEILSTQASARGVSLSTALTWQAPHISGDRIQLQQVILNLVMNGMDAIGSAPRWGRHIIARTTVKDDASAEVSIEDSGPGIPPEQTQEIFKPFFTTKVAGMGMGLSIARTIVESHGGRIWAENHSLGGAVFRFTLPLVKSGARRIAGETALYDDEARESSSEVGALTGEPALSGEARRM